jgi:hypothetical protein
MLSGAAEQWCDACAKRVHDFSMMRESEVRDLLARHVGEAICVDYRTRADGTIRVRESAPLGGVTSLALLLSACAPHVEEEELAKPGDCVDVGGCDEEVASWWLLPDETSVDSDSRRRRRNRTVADGSPVRSRARDESSSALGEHEDHSPRDVEAGKIHAPEQTVRIDFAINPEEHVRGMLIIHEDEWHDKHGRLRFVPTRRLLADLRDRLRAWRSR